MNRYNEHRGNCICRCAQPKTGLKGKTCASDEFLIDQIRQSVALTAPGLQREKRGESLSADTLVFIDCRSKVAALGK